MVTLKLNDHGLEVIKLQLLLNIYHRPCPSGRFDQRTHNTVTAFQKAKKLTVDGKVGINTWKALGVTTTAPKPTPLQTTKPWLDIAYAEYGVVGDLSPGKHTARILEYHQTTTLKATTDETAWCSSFVNWVITQSGRKGTNNALAKSWLNWGISVPTPQRGDIVVIKKITAGYSSATGSSSGYHVAFYISSTDTHITLLGGNQSNKVKESNYPLSKYEVQGYRRPQ